MSTIGTVGSINVLFNVQMSAAERGMNRFASSVETSGRRVKGSVDGIDRSVVSMNRTIASIRGREFRTLSLSALRASNSVDRLRGVMLAFSALGGGLAAAFSVKGVVEYSDAYKQVANRLRVVKGEAQSLAGLEQSIFDVAQRSRAQYQSTGVLYARIAQSAKKLNLTQKDTLRVTETIQKAFQLGGSTPVEAAQSAIQLSQGIASNRLQGDELRSILENPALGQLLADQVADGDIAKLREMAKEGELTAKVVIDAFKNASGEIDRLFSGTTQTIGQALVRVDNALLKYIGTNAQVAKGTGATVTLLNALADNIDSVASAALTLGAVFAGSLGKKAFTGLVAGTQELLRQNAAIRTNAAAAVEAAKAGALSAKLDKTRQSQALRNQKLATDARLAALKVSAIESNTISTTKDLTNKKEGLAAVEKSRLSVVQAVSAAEMKAADEINRALNERNALYRKRAALEKQIAATAASGNTRLQGEAIRGLAAQKAPISDAIAQSSARIQELRSAASNAAAAASVRLAAADTALANAAKAVTLAETNLATAMAGGNLTKQQSSKLAAVQLAEQNKLAAASKNYSLAVQSSLQANRLAAATQGAYAASLTRTGFAATTSALAIRGFNAAIGFVGGPFNAILLALGVAMFLVSQRAATAQAAVDYYADAITRAGGASSLSAGSIYEAVYALESVTRAANDAATFSEINDATARMAENFYQAREAALALGVQAGATGNALGVGLASKITDIINRNEDGRISFVDLRAELNALASQNPSFAGIINGIINVASAANAARIQIGALNAAIAGDVGGFRADIRKPAKGDFPGKVTGAENFFDSPDYRSRFYGDEKEKLGGSLDALKKQRIDDAKGPKKKKGRGGGGGKETPQEKIADKLFELDNKIQTIDFDKVNQDTVDMARSAGLANDQIDKFISAVKGGGDTVPPVMEKIRSKLQQVADVEFNQKLKELHDDGTIALMSELDQKVLSTARSLGLAESKIKDFIAAGGGVAGLPPEFAAIRTELERIEQNERITQFADDLAGAFGDFARSASKDFKNVGEHAKELALKITDLIFEMLVIEPLMKSIRNSFGGGGGAKGGGGIFGALGNVASALLGGIFHEGGTVANDNKPLVRHSGGGTNRMSGIKHNEVMSLLEKGETVFTKRQTDSIGNSLAASTTNIRQMEPSSANISISVDDDGKIKAMVDKGSAQAARAGAAMGQKQMVRRLPSINRGYQQYGKVVA